jgi:hypothetical protein
MAVMRGMPREVSGEAADRRSTAEKRVPGGGLRVGLPVRENEEAEARSLVTVGIPGPIDSSERHLGPSVVLLPRHPAGEFPVAFAVPAAVAAGPAKACPYSASSASGDTAA